MGSSVNADVVPSLLSGSRHTMAPASLRCCRGKTGGQVGKRRSFLPCASLCFPK